MLYSLTQYFTGTFTHIICWYLITMQYCKVNSKKMPDIDCEEEETDDGEKPPTTDPVQYAYLDHTADVQLHAWGQSLEEALQQLVIALYGYMTTDMSRVEPVYSMDFAASGHDLHSLVYNLLDTCLYNFCAEPFFIGCSARVLKLKRPTKDKEDAELSIQLRVWGDSFDPQKHPPGTEVKAITYSNMQVMEPQQQQCKAESDDVVNKPAADEDLDVKNKRTDVFVIIDI